MKTILTLVCILTLGAVALANPEESHDKINPIKVDFVLDSCTNSAHNIQKVKTDTNREVARLYRRKNTLVKKALNFSTKKSKAKLA